MDFINAQLGRILLVLAVIITIVSTSMNGPQVLPQPEQKDLDRPVLVHLDKSTLGVASSEEYFVKGLGSEWAGSERYVFVQEKKVKEFVPVLLELPPAGIARAPQVMPEYGPSLEGSISLPRFGEEFPPIAPAAAKGNEPPPRATNPK
ncbi:MAG TPA: hypothetical protein VEJ63_08700 [Planctomycetota bacterium]|nr:hypothetical protein [Planctomycetota bacterium]